MFEESGFVIGAIHTSHHTQLIKNENTIDSLPDKDNYMCDRLN